MPLEEYGKYETIGGRKVHLLGTMEHEDMFFNYSHELALILGIQDRSYENLREVLKDEKVFHGLTDEMIMLSGDWHEKTGKCLGLNTGGVMGRGEALRKRLEQFDIKVEE